MAVAVEGSDTALGPEWDVGLGAEFDAEEELAFCATELEIELDEGALPREDGAAFAPTDVSVRPPPALFATPKGAPITDPPPEENDADAFPFSPLELMAISWEGVEAKLAPVERGFEGGVKYSRGVGGEKLLPQAATERSPEKSRP